MQAKGFFGSLFDYSFSSFITSRIIKVLYVLSTIVVGLWTLVFILVAFKASSALGILALLIGGPIFFVVAMIYVRVGLELLIVFFRIHENVQEINQRAGGAIGTPFAPAPPPAGPFSARPDAEVAVPPAGSPPETGKERAFTATAAGPVSEAAPLPLGHSRPESSATPAPTVRFCENCGTERSPGKRFCVGCGEPFE